MFIETLNESEKLTDKIYHIISKKDEFNLRIIKKEIQNQ